MKANKMEHKKYGRRKATLPKLKVKSNYGYNFMIKDCFGIPEILPNNLATNLTKIFSRIQIGNQSAHSLSRQGALPLLVDDLQMEQTKLSGIISPRYQRDRTDVKSTQAFPCFRGTLANPPLRKNPLVSRL